MDKLIDKQNKILFLNLLKEFNPETYKAIGDKQLVLDLLVGKSEDTPVIINSTEIPTSIIMVDNKVANAYQKITGRSCSIFYDHIQKDTLDKYDSLDDYYRVKEVASKNRKLKDESIIQKYKVEYELLMNNPSEIIQRQQKEIEDLKKEINKLNKKIK